MKNTTQDYSDNSNASSTRGDYTDTTKSQDGRKNNGNRDSAHMAEIGRKGGQNSHKNA